MFLQRNISQPNPHGSFSLEKVPCHRVVCILVIYLSESREMWNTSWLFLLSRGFTVSSWELQKSQNFTLFGETQDFPYRFVLWVTTRLKLEWRSATDVLKTAVLYRSKSERTRETATLQEIIRGGREEERRGEKIDRCQEGAGLGVTRKMGLIPPPIPAAFLLFEVTSGLNFPLWVEQKGSLLGGWTGAAGRSCLPG